MGLQISRFSNLSILFLSVFLLSSCYSIRSVFWYPTGIKDYKRFSYNEINNPKTSTVFSIRSSSLSLEIPENCVKKVDSGSFEGFLKRSKSVVFLILRNDSLVFSEYDNRFCESSIFPSFSIAKSFVSALIGIALEEGIITSLDQPVTDFFPELEKSGYRKVTIRHLLTMRSGIDFSEGYKNPFGDASKLYYGRNLKKFVFRKKVVEEPGKKYSYASGNTQLLAMVLEKASGMKISDYLEEKLWKPLGMQYSATWSIDSKKHHETKAFCCINGRAVDFARFGQLYLDLGKKEGRSIVPEQWIKESLTIQNDSRDSRGFPYAYSWRVRENGEFFAYGVLGQYIYVSPQKKIVMVRLGEDTGGVDWPELFHKLIKQL